MDNGKISVQCFADCDIDDVLQPIGLKARDLYPDKPEATKPKPQIVCTYDYHDADGRLAFQVVRYQPKHFKQRRPDTTKPGGWAWNLDGIDRPLYRLPDVLKAKAEGQPVFLVEGEKDADALAALGLTATTNAGGAGRWTDADADVLQGCDVIIIPDNDAPGIKAAWRRFDSIWGATLVVLPGLPDKGDVSDWLAAVGTVGELWALVGAARNNPPERPTEATTTPEATATDIDPLSELANAHRFKMASDGNIMNDPALGWMAYSDGHYQPGEREAIKVAGAVGSMVRRDGHATTTDPDIIKQYYSAARRAESARGVEATLKLARALPGIDATHVKWDRDEWLVNVRNGTVDARTLTLMPHERSDYLTRCIPIDFDPKATCPTWESHLDKVFSGDRALIHYIKFLFGYSITGSMAHQLFVICHGEAGHGKSTTIEAPMYAMGPYANAVAHDVVLDQHHAGHSCTLAALCGLRFGLVSELPEGSRWNEAQVKRLATGDTLAARLIGQNPFSFKSTMKLWVNCNARPEFRDSGGGMARRIRCVPFTVDMTGPDRDRNIEHKLRDEAPGILRWILEGARIAYEGEPEIPEVVRASSREYVRQNDLMANFLDECCIEGPHNRAEVGSAYDAFRTWGGGDLSKRKFGMLLSTRFDQYREARSRYWIGFALK